MCYYYLSHSGPFWLVLVYGAPTCGKGLCIRQVSQNKFKCENMKKFQLLVLRLVCYWVGGECGHQPLMGAAKKMNGRNKRYRTAAGGSRRRKRQCMHNGGAEKSGQRTTQQQAKGLQMTRQPTIIGSVEGGQQLATRATGDDRQQRGMMMMTTEKEES